LELKQSLILKSSNTHRKLAYAWGIEKIFDKVGLIEYIGYRSAHCDSGHLDTVVMLMGIAK